VADDTDDAEEPGWPVATTDEARGILGLSWGRRVSRGQYG
jgi:hypothetical protein